MKTSVIPNYYPLSRPQLEFSNMRCRFPLFCAGLGAGKTSCMVINAIEAVRNRGKGSSYAIFEPTYRLIQEVAKPELDKWLELQKIKHKYNSTWAFYTLPGNRIIYLKSQEDPDNIRGLQITAGGALDELEYWDLDKQRVIFNKTAERIRVPSPAGFVQQLRVYTTPDKGTSGLTYQLWGINPTLPPTEQKKRSEYQFVTATTESNVKNVGEAYIENLKSIHSDKALECYLYGKWVNLACGLVYEAYDRVQCRSTETVTPNDATLYVGMDFNVGHMAAIVNVRRYNPNKNGRFPYQYHAVREFIDFSDTPSMIVKLKQEYPRQKILIYPDCAGASKKSTDASTSDITLLQQAGYTCRHHPSHPAVKDRVLSMNRALRQREFLVNDELCPILAKNMSEQAYNDKGEPSKVNNIDHPLDAQGYLIEYEMPIRSSRMGLGISTA